MCSELPSKQALHGNIEQCDVCCINSTTCKVLIVHALCCSNVNTSPCSQKMEEVQSSLSLLYRRYGIYLIPLLRSSSKQLLKKCSSR